MLKKGMAICATLIVGMMVLTGCSGGKDASTTQATTEQTTAATTVATTQATTAAKVPDNMESVDFHQVTFNVPKTWEAKKNSENINEYYPKDDQSSFMAAQRQPNIPISVDFVQYKDFFIQGLQNTSPGFQLIKSEEVNINGVKSLYVEYKFNPNGTMEFKSDTYVFSGKDGIYSFMYATANKKNTEHNKDFKVVIESIKQK